MRGLPNSIFLVKSRDHGSWVLRHQSHHQLQHIMQIFILRTDRWRREQLKENNTNCVVCVNYITSVSFNCYYALSKSSSSCNSCSSNPKRKDAQNLSNSFLWDHQLLSDQLARTTRPAFSGSTMRSLPSSQS